MKNRKSFFISLLLLKVLLLTSATNAFAFSEPVLDLDSRKGDFFKTEQNKTAVFWEESLAEFSLQKSSENDTKISYGNSDFQFKFLTCATASKNQLTSLFQPDGKRILKTQIFPFHFFW